MVPQPRADNIARGIVFVVATTMIFACQDAVTKLLAQDYPAAQILWVRYVMFAAFALVLAGRKRPLAHVFRSTRPWLQIGRSLVIVAEIGLFIVAVRQLPLINAHALLATTPLIVTALSALFLGEIVGIRRWSAVLVGFAGVMVILRPGLGVFEASSVWALLAAFLYAAYQAMTREVSRYDDGETSLLYMAAVGAVAMTCIGPWFWVAPTPLAWTGLAAIAVTGTAGHLLLIKALENAPASVLQPFNYTLLVWATLVGFVVFGDFPDTWTIVGAIIVVASGLYTLYRERARKGGAVASP